MKHVFGRIVRMYERYGQKIGWSVKPISASEPDMGGFKELVISVKGDLCIVNLNLKLVYIECKSSSDRISRKSSYIYCYSSSHARRDPVELNDPTDLEVGTADLRNGRSEC